MSTRSARWDALLDALARHEDAQSLAYGDTARALGSPCLAGCHGCCHRLVLVDLADALAIARHLVDQHAVTDARRAALADHAERAERLSPDDLFASAVGCPFLDRGSAAAACTIYPVRPHDCRAWFVHGVPDGSWCGPGAPERTLDQVTRPDLEDEDVRVRARLASQLAARPTWVPLALGVLAALDAMERGPAALAAWRPRLDAATARSHALVDDLPDPR